MRIPTTDEIIRKLDETYNQRSHNKLMAQGIQCYLALYDSDREMTTRNICEWLIENCDEYSADSVSDINAMVGKSATWLATAPKCVKKGETTRGSFKANLWSVCGSYACAMIFLENTKEEKEETKEQEVEEVTVKEDVKEQTEPANDNTTQSVEELTYLGFKKEACEVINSYWTLWNRDSLDELMMKINKVYAKYAAIDIYKQGRESVKEEMRKALEH